MSRALLGIDVGTTGVRAVVVTEAGRTVVQAAEPCPPDTRDNGRAEADPEAWWAAVRTVLGRLGPSLGDVRGIGVVGQAPTAVLLDADARPVRPAILWLDVRADVEARMLESRLGPGGVEAIGGNRSHAYFLGPKLAWLQAHEPRALERTALILSSHAFIVLRLTGEATCDASVGMLCAPLFDASARGWSKLGARAVGVDLAKLPRIASAADVVGHVTKRAAQLTGLREGTPVVAGGADFAAAALGSGVIEEGQVGLMLGTAGNLLVPMTEPRFDTRLIHSHHVGVERWLAIGGTLCGAALDWFREACASGASWETLEDEVTGVDDPSGLIVLPYFQGERTPIWNEKARAVIFGANLTHRRAHLYRALLEGIALGFKHAARVAEESGVRLVDVVATNGAGRSGVLRQILCDALGVPLEWTDDGGGTVRGAAALAGLGTGALSDVEALRPWLPCGVARVRHVPEPRSQARLDRLFVRRLALYEGLKSEFSGDKLPEIRQ
jgi:xylulokinase